MGRHADVRRRRGIASWPLVAAGVVVLLVAVAVMYVFVLKNDNDKTPQACTGSATLTVLASSGSSPAARALSDAFNATAPSARSTCVTSQVVTAASGDAAGMLAGGWQGRSDPPPAVWITDDASQLAALEKSDPAITAGRDTEPLATSPVVLAMRSDASSGLTGKRSWQQFATSFATGGGTSGQQLLAPDPRDNRASSYALSSMFAVDGALPSVSEIGAAATTVRSMIDRQSTDLATTGDALQLLTDGGDGAERLAVPVTEADLAAYNSSAASPLTAVYPSGPAVGDEVYVISLTMDGLDDIQRDAATRFHSFARDTAGKQMFTAARMRVPGLTTSTAPGIDADTTVTVLPGTESGQEDAWAGALGLPGDGSPSPSTTGSTPANSGTAGPSTPPVPVTTSTSVSGPPSSGPSSTGPSGTPRPSTTPVTTRTSPSSTSPSSTPVPTTGPGVTFLADTSATWETEVSGLTRTAWLQQALTGAVATTGTSRFGLWSASSEDQPSGYARLAPLAARSPALDAGIGALGSSGERRYYAAVPAVLQQVSTAATPSSPQRVVLITDGPDQTPSTSRAAVVQAIREVMAANPSLSLDVVGVGENAPDSALVALAAAGNGTYYDVVSTSNLPATLLSVMSGT
ncbi:MAG: VWA domain-containing protein [Nakamurella sp.]